jgi:hypothetical protein
MKNKEFLNQKMCDMTIDELLSAIIIKRKELKEAKKKTEKFEEKKVEERARLLDDLDKIKGRISAL